MADDLTLLGVAAAAPASELGELFEADLATPGGEAFTALALLSWYSLDVSTVIDPKALPGVRLIGDGCMTNPLQGPLFKYVGSHPSTPVDGERFLEEASVRKAVAANVTDAAVRKFVFEYNGPDAPIVAKAGRILAWGCERHNCGYNNWAIAITPDGTNAEVCYHRDNDRPDGTSTWYLPGGTKEQRPGNCPSD